MHADIYRVLDDPREAAQARVDIIQQARGEIGALYFLARDDRITLSSLALLRDAQRRGVHVRLLVDANFHRIPKAVLAHLRDEGVGIRVYHPLTLRHPSWMFRRMHEKLVVVDGRKYVTGGRNLAESYFGLAKKKNYVDRDVYVEGPSAGDADTHFEKLWSSKHVAELDVHVRKGEKKMAELRLGDALRELAASGFIQLNTGCNWAEGQKEVELVRLLHDPISGDGPRVAVRLDEILRDAKQSIVFESPYFVPPKSLRQLILRKRAEGVRILVLTNSLRSTDGVFPQAAYLKYRRELVRAGVDVREFKGPDTLHAKTILVDDRIVLVGSYNIDPRSQNLNTEVMCVTEDEEIARGVRDSIEQRLQHAWVREPRPSRAVSFRMWAARLLLPLIENQL